MRLLACLLALAAAPPVLATSLLAAAQSADPRTHYDVESYHLALRVDPSERKIAGSVTVTAHVVADELAIVRLDVDDGLTVEGVTAGDAPLAFQHEGDLLDCTLPAPLAKGAAFALTVRYHGSPRALPDKFTGFHWAETADGRPWINTSCQGIGAHTWWPCKASFFHPDDKPERLRVDLEVPAGLYAVSNGRLVGVEEREGSTLYRWQHDYPLETYTVTLNVAPYVVVEKELELAGIEEPVPFVYYVLPENAEKAAIQFEQVPELLAIFSDAFGPWPFPKSKFGLVETNFWGMEHSTAVAYGSSYPAWCEIAGARDPYAGRNRYFDYILVHEVAHEWWGNAVSAEHWGDFWLHEGFGTYAEGVYVERTQGREVADRYFAEQARGSTSGRGRLFRGEDVDSGEAYSGLIYSKGACVLNTLRHYVADDEAWWKALREFNLQHRYGNATTADFARVLEETTGEPWKRFFDEWYYGYGAPKLEGTVAVDGSRIVVTIENGATGATGFHVPLDLRWTEAGEERTARVMVPPGAFSDAIVCAAPPRDVEVVGLHRVLGKHAVRVESRD